LQPSATTAPPDAGLQAHFYRPPEIPPHRPDTTRPASLEGNGITHELTTHERCALGYWKRGVCRKHGNTRWIYCPCKERRCPVCGPERRRKVAARIAEGIEKLSGAEGAAWFVGTWSQDVSKSQAVRTVARFIAWIRRQRPRRVEYAATWELTAQGRLHVNLVMAPWMYIPQHHLSQEWRKLGGGKVVWIKRVGAGVGQEAAKSRQQAASYFSKAEQMVYQGRAASYSKGWPKLPDGEPPPRVGEIAWIIRSALPPNDVTWPQFTTERQLNLWYEDVPDEWAPVHPHLRCNCFQLLLPANLDSPRDVPT